MCFPIQKSHMVPSCALKHDEFGSFGLSFRHWMLAPIGLLTLLLVYGMSFTNRL